MKIPPLEKSYGGSLVLKMPELETESGRIYAVIGANGSGKTTFARLVSGVEKSDNKAELCLGAVGYMPQRSYAFRMSTRANIMLGGTESERCERLMEALHIEKLADRSAQKLSGGETARMALARLLMGKYRLLVLDEPTAAMDMESTVFAEELIKSYRDETGCAVILVTHSISQAGRVADEIMFLDRGELAERGEKELLLSCPREEKTRRFLEFYG